MKSRVNKYLPYAIEHAQELRKEKQPNGEIKILDYIPKEFKGYIASFGASIIQSGLLPTLAFFSNDEGASRERSRILTAICRIINEIDHYSEDMEECNLIGYVRNNINDLDKVTDKIMDAATALKLAIRTYELK